MPTENRFNKQTIDGVPRDLLQKIADGGYCHQGLMDRLRALLVAPVPTPIDYGSLDAVQRLALCRGDRPVLLARSPEVPDGYCIMPKSLTAENGAKASLLGEFKLLVAKECPECCELEEPIEDCEICDGTGEYGQSYTIPWDQIKFIYSKAVKGLAIQN